jgi:ATP-dependent NAD(P)H-hydrate dehydratase
MMMDSGEEEGSSGEELSKSPDYEKLRLLVPDLDSSKFHKGQAGKIGVVGGCEEYTGAPYFAAMSALRMGADLAHVFCAEGAGHVIKSYSPELIVHPYMREGGSGSNGGTHTAYDAELVTEAMEKIEPWLDRMSALVVGPGLGRDPTMCETAKRIIAAACEKDIPLVIDADGIRLVMEDPSLVSENGRVVLTPNKAELDRFRDWEWVPGTSTTDIATDTATDIASDIADGLNGPVVVAKGEADVVVTHASRDDDSDDEGPYSRKGREPEIAPLEGTHEYRRSYVCDELGSPRRCGGQGDVLAGTIATFLAWSTRSEAAECAIVGATMHLEDIPKTEGHLFKFMFAPNVFASRASSLAAYAGCMVTRVAARAAFDKKRRSMLASDVIDELGDTMQRLFPVETESDI